MRNYWIKIALSALGIFAVGMVAITGFRSLKGKVTRAINSTDPIPIPVIGLVPFRVDSARLGSVSRVEFLRSDPQHISGVRVLVKLADSVQPGQLGSCQLALDDVNNLNDHTTFSCQPTTGPVSGMESFGFVVVRNTHDSIPLLLPVKAASDLRATRFSFNGHEFKVDTPRDSIAEALAARLDSVRDQMESRIDARGDSIETLKDLAAQLEDSSTEAPAVERRKLQKRADSVRAVMRATVERMKLDEATLRGLKGSHVGLTEAQRDSLARLGPMLADSIRRAVAQELGRVQADLNRGHPAPAAGAAAPPPPPAKPR